MLDIRALLERQVHTLVGFGSGEIDLERGDSGLFGPQSAAWKVHGDFTTMMIGGIAALLMQMLHPGALAGVWDHSNFRQDMLGRLRRTAQFIAGTTYGSTEQAERLIDRVRTIHDRVAGVLPDGRPYSANDPDLLTWVHAAEVSSFLAAYLRYRDPAFPLAEQDRYLSETATIARRLGATAVPTTRAELEAYFGRVRPDLRSDARTREVARALLTQPAPNPALAPFGMLMMQAGIDLLPDWAARMHGLRSAPAPAIRAGVHGVGKVMRWALRDSSARRARRRVAPKP
ncbi:oxygenase MpaB family protein [Sphingomonas crusticola]|uniref:oxygenase MpaB family protein n=1 Tax=Sphingomonas crusticola TaxID=1697973 RepID=UPI000E258E23|nr:oxygenase MpaB family protein [Sphingomonas crusticola]